METSAKSGFNVELLFRKIAKDLYVEDLEMVASSNDSEKEEKEHGKNIILTKEYGSRNSATRNRNTCKCS